jgi:ankyrin repeat protein
LIYFSGEWDIAKLLIIRGADVDAETEDKWTPLHFAAQKGQRNIAEVLIEKGADVNAPDVNGFMPIHVAAENGNK